MAKKNHMSLKAEREVKKDLMDKWCKSVPLRKEVTEMTFAQARDILGRFTFSVNFLKAKTPIDARKCLNKMSHKQLLMLEQLDTSRIMERIEARA